MTQRGYHVSVFEIMSLVPRAITIAVVFLVMDLANTSAPTDAFRPTLASMVTLAHVAIAVLCTLGDPKAFVPTVRESPINNNSPCPLASAGEDFGAALAW